MEFKDYFMTGLSGSLRLKNGVNFSYKGPWVQIEPDTVIDEWYHGEFMAAEYTICVDAGNIDKEIIKAVVVAGPSQAKVNLFSRVTLNNELITLSAVVNSSKVSIIANPSAFIGTKKLIFSSVYYETINELVRE